MGVQLRPVHSGPSELSSSISRATAPRSLCSADGPRAAQATADPSTGAPWIGDAMPRKQPATIALWSAAESRLFETAVHSPALDRELDGHRIAARNPREGRHPAAEAVVDRPRAQHSDHDRRATLPSHTRRVASQSYVHWSVQQAVRASCWSSSSRRRAGFCRLCRPDSSLGSVCSDRCERSELSSKTKSFFRLGLAVQSWIRACVLRGRHT